MANEKLSLIGPYRSVRLIPPRFQFTKLKVFSIFNCGNTSMFEIFQKLNIIKTKEFYFPQSQRLADKFDTTHTQYCQLDRNTTKCISSNEKFPLNIRATTYTVHKLYSVLIFQTSTTAAKCIIGQQFAT